MNKNKRHYYFLGILLLLLLVSMGFYNINLYMKIKKTETTIGKVVVVINKTLKEEKFTTLYSVYNETVQFFPDLKNDACKIFDGWEEEIIVSINKRANLFYVTITSSGRDRILNTSDDISVNFTQEL